MTDDTTAFARGGLYRALSAALMAGTLLSTAHFGATVVQAQSSQPQSGVINIPAGPLTPALNRLAAQTGLQILYDASLAAGRTTNGVTGATTPNQALSALLSGTGVTFRYTSANTVTIIDPNSAGSATVDGAIPLDTIDVSGGGGVSAAADLPYQSPGSSAYISGEQIERVPPINPGDMFRSTPGVIAAGNRVGPSMNLNIRGLQGKDRVAVMVDGTRQSNNSYRGYQGSRNEVYVDPDFLGGIEITKGPSSEAGGIGAMGGVVNMRTLEAEDIVGPGQTTGTRLKVGLGSNTIDPPPAGTQVMRDKDDEHAFGDAWSGSVVSAAKQENYDLLFGFARRTTGNYFAGTKGTEIYYDKDFQGNPRQREVSPFKHGDEVFGTSQSVISFISKGNVKWGDGHKLETGYIYYNNNYGELNETALAFSVGTGIRFPAAQPYIAETTTHTLRARYAYDPSGNDLIAFKAGLWATDVKTINEPAEKSIRTYGGDISNRARFDTAFGQFVVLTGAEAILEHGAADPGGQNVDLSNPVSEPKGERQMLGAFTRTTWQPTKWLTLDAGLRFDRYEAIPDNPDYSHKQGERASPSASITLTPLDGLQLFASYVEGWRPPSLRETTAGAPNNYLLPNPDLDPEISKNVEFGVNVLRGDVLMAGDQVRFKAVRFHNNYQDYIVRGQPPGSPGYTWINIDRAEFDGYEVSGAYDVGFAFLEAGFTKYDKAEFCQNEWWTGNVCNANGVGQDYGIQNMPPEYSGNITAGVRLLDRRLTLGASAYFFGEKLGGYQQAPDSTVAPVYYTANTIVNLFGSYQFEERAKLDFSVENIADRYYVEPLATGVIPSPGRTARFSLTLQF